MDFTRVSTYNRENLNNYNPGKMDKKIEIYHPNVGGSRNEHGELIKSPILYKRTWAQVVPLRGIEYDRASVEENKVFYRVSCRYLPKAHEDMFIMYEGRKLLIQAVLDVAGKKRFTEFAAYEHIKNKGSLGVMDG